MPDQFALITGIDRTNRLVGAILDDGFSQWLPAGFAYFGEPPAPLSRAWFTEIASGVHVCVGSVGDARIVLHDDFTIVFVPALGFVANDTQWVARATGGTFAQDTSVADKQGAMLMTTNAVLFAAVGMSKDTSAINPPTAPAALWWSGRFRAGATITTMAARAGLGESGVWAFAALGGATTASVFVDYNTATSANWLLQTATTAAATATNTGIPVVGAQWYWFDVVYVPGLWATCWIDGSGPYVSTSTIPAAATPLSVGHGVFTSAASARQASIDTSHLEYVPGVADPRLLDPTTHREGTDAPVIIG